VSGSDYSSAGVGGQGDALSSVVRHLGPTLPLPEGASVLTRFGQYASVLKISEDVAIAISTDGVGSKTIVAAALDRYDTIGFDCVAMNANDILCVGARPIAMVDYLGVNTLDSRRADEVLRGLGAAAKEAGIAIPGGELAQLPEVIGPGANDFDLVGTCVGTVHPDRVVTGAAVEPGDALVGIASSGIHANGLTLARRVLLADGRYRLGDTPERLGQTLGDELLEPTASYVRAVVALWDAGVETCGLAHVTSDGFANLCRLDAPVGYVVEALPPRPRIFDLIQAEGGIEEVEMFRVFNMGVGFVVVVRDQAQEDALRALEGAGYSALRIGRVTDEEGAVRIVPAGLAGGWRDGASYFASV
jgi:phosphoribosylformylglycinamidine cyclo-ligase